MAITICWIGQKYLRDLQEITLFTPATLICKGYLMTEKEIVELAEKRGWKVKRTVNYSKEG